MENRALELTQEYFEVLNRVIDKEFYNNNKDLCLPITSASNDASQIVCGQTSLIENVDRYKLKANWMFYKESPKGAVMAYQENIYVTAQSKHFFKVNEYVEAYIMNAYNTMGGNGYWLIHKLDEKKVIPIFREVLKAWQPVGKVIITNPVLGAYSRGYRPEHFPADYYGWSQILSTTLQRIKLRPRVQEISINSIL